MHGVVPRLFIHCSLYSSPDVQRRMLLYVRLAHGLMKGGYGTDNGLKA